MNVSNVKAEHGTTESASFAAHYGDVVCFHKRPDDALSQVHEPHQFATS
tara:strand:- start:173 stop:319 length:147 start_codon:yes stop_codon:yes gene_type:complete